MPAAKVVASTSDATAVAAVAAVNTWAATLAEANTSGARARGKRKLEAHSAGPAHSAELAFPPAAKGSANALVLAAAARCPDATVRMQESRSPGVLRYSGIPSSGEPPSAAPCLIRESYARW